MPYDKSSWSNQRLFNHIAKHLLKQNKKSINRAELCVLFNPETEDRCAIGCLLPKKVYKSGKYHFYSIIGPVLSLCGLLKEDNYTRNHLLSELAECHDHVKPSRWPQRLRAIAKEFDLNIPDFFKGDIY